MSRKLVVDKQICFYQIQNDKPASTATVFQKCNLTTLYRHFMTTLVTLLHPIRAMSKKILVDKQICFYLIQKR